jgi:hypothetical protein
MCCYVTKVFAPLDANLPAVKFAIYGIIKDSDFVMPVRRESLSSVTVADDENEIGGLHRRLMIEWLRRKIPQRDGDAESLGERIEELARAFGVGDGVESNLRLEGICLAELQKGPEVADEEVGPEAARPLPAAEVLNIADLLEGFVRVARNLPG